MWRKRRKFDIFLKVATALVLWSTTPVLIAQTRLACTANSSTPPLVRGEQITEFTGNLLLACTGGTGIPGAATNTEVTKG
jgi:hypothetical protein